MHVQPPEPRAQDGEEDVLSTNLPYTARALTLTLTLTLNLTQTLTPTLTLIQHLPKLSALTLTLLTLTLTVILELKRCTLCLLLSWGDGTHSWSVLHLLSSHSPLTIVLKGSNY